MSLLPCKVGWSTSHCSNNISTAATLHVHAKASRVRVVASGLVNIQETTKTEVVHGGVVAGLVVNRDGVNDLLDFVVAVGALGQQKADHQQVARGNSFPDGLGGVVVDEMDLSFVSLAANSVLRALAVFSSPMKVSLQVKAGSESLLLPIQTSPLTCSKPQVAPL